MHLDISGVRHHTSGMGTDRTYRRHLGASFNEGARLMWMGLERTGMTQAELQRAMKIGAGLVSRWLYGDRKPGRSAANKLRDVLAIPTSAWDQPPTKPFTPPAAAEDSASTDAA